MTRDIDDIGLIDEDACRKFQTGIELVGKRWSASILLASARGAQRYSDYFRMIDGISERLLATRLRELTTYRLLERVVTPTTPVQVTYTLSVRGKELLVSLAPLIKWGQKWDIEVVPAAQDREAVILATEA